MYEKWIKVRISYFVELPQSNFPKHTVPDLSLTLALFIDFSLTSTEFQVSRNSRKVVTLYLGFDITVHDAFGMNKLDRRHKFSCDEAGFSLREVFLAANSIEQFASGQQLHHNVHVKLKRQRSAKVGLRLSQSAWTSFARRSFSTAVSQLGTHCHLLC